MKNSQGRQTTLKPSSSSKLVLKSYTKKEHQRSNSTSILLNNKLTKSYFSVCDTSLYQPSQSLKPQVKIRLKQSNQSIGSGFLNRYESAGKIGSESPKFHTITEAAIPKLNFRRKEDKASTVK